MMDEKTVVVDIQSGVATIRLNRPSAMNSLNDALVRDMTAALNQVQADPAIRAVVLTGNGKAFCAGGDLFFLASLQQLTEARQFIAAAGNMTSLIMSLEKPVIAMVNGVAAGAGFNLALACDIVFCAKSARFAQSFSKVGLVPDCGGMYLLPRVVGRHKAKELMFTADLIDAETALKLGVVNQVVEDAQLEEATYAFANRMAAGAPLALALMKRVLNQSDNYDLATTLEFEADMQALCMQTDDHVEGVTAFKEKRPPVFKGV